MVPSPVARGVPWLTVHLNYTHHFFNHSLTVSSYSCENEYKNGHVCLLPSVTSLIFFKWFFHQDNFDWSIRMNLTPPSLLPARSVFNFRGAIIQALIDWKTSQWNLKNLIRTQKLVCREFINLLPISQLMRSQFGWFTPQNQKVTKIYKAIIKSNIQRGFHSEAYIISASAQQRGFALPSFVYDWSHSLPPITLIKFPLIRNHLGRTHFGLQFYYHWIYCFCY